MVTKWRLWAHLFVGKRFEFRVSGVPDHVVGCFFSRAFVWWVRWRSVLLPSLTTSVCVSHFSYAILMSQALYQIMFHVFFHFHPKQVFQTKLSGIGVILEMPIDVVKLRLQFALSLFNYDNLLTITSFGSASQTLNTETWCYICQII